MQKTVKSNENNDLKYRQGLPDTIPGGKTMPIGNIVPIDESSSDDEKLEYFTE